MQTVRKAWLKSRLNLNVGVRAWNVLKLSSTNLHVHKTFQTRTNDQGNEFPHNLPNGRQTILGEKITYQNPRECCINLLDLYIVFLYKPHTSENIWN